MGTEGREGGGDWLLKHVLEPYLPPFLSLPLLLVLALFRALRFERGRGWLRGGGVGWFYWIDALWLVVTITWVCTLVFGRKAYGFGIAAGLFLFVLLHSGIAHAADHYAGYHPGDEFRTEAAVRKGNRDTPDGEQAQRGGTGGGGHA